MMIKLLGSEIAMEMQSRVSKTSNMKNQTQVGETQALRANERVGVDDHVY